MALCVKAWWWCGRLHTPLCCCRAFTFPAPEVKPKHKMLNAWPCSCDQRLKRNYKIKSPFNGAAVCEQMFHSELCDSHSVSYKRRPQVYKCTLTVTLKAFCFTNASWKEKIRAGLLPQMDQRKCEDEKMWNEESFFPRAVLLHRLITTCLIPQWPQSSLHSWDLLQHSVRNTTVLFDPPPLRHNENQTGAFASTSRDRARGYNTASRIQSET